MPIDTIKPNPSTYTWQLNRTVENKSVVDTNSNLTSSLDIAAVTVVNAKSLLHASVVRDLSKPITSTSDDVAKLGKMVENGKIAESQKTMEVIKAKNDMAMLAVVQKKTLLAGVSVSLSSSFSAAESGGSSGRQAVLAQADRDVIASAEGAAAFTRTSLPSATEYIDSSSAADDVDMLSIFETLVNNNQYSTSSSKEICDAVADAIASMGENYLDVFQEAVEKYASFYADFSEAIASLKNAIAADDDKIIFIGSTFAAELQSVIDKYSGDAGVLYRASSAEEAKAWAKEMGLDPDKCVDGTNVRIDLTAIQKLATDSNKIAILNSAQWAAYQSSVDITKDSVQTSMQSLTQKYSNANSTFDNLVKILSSTISQLLESDKSFFNI